MSSKRTRRLCTTGFKAEGTLAALTERQSLANRAAHGQLAVAHIACRRMQLRQQAAQVFAEAPPAVVPSPDWGLCTPPSAGCQWKTRC